MDIELIVALITVAIAVAVPAITNKQNNDHQIQIKKMDMIFSEKQKIYFEFADTYAIALADPSDSNISAFRAAAHKCFILNTTDDFYKNALNCINHLEKHASKSDTEKYFRLCVISLSFDLENMTFDFENPIR